MKKLSRRDFLRLSGAAVLAVGMTGVLSGCDDSTSSSVQVKPFGAEIAVGDCVVTFLKVGGTRSAERGGLMQEVELSLKNGGAEFSLEKADFEVKINKSRTLEISDVAKCDANWRSVESGTIKCAKGETTNIRVWLKTQPHIDDVQDIQASVTIHNKKVTAATTKDKIKLGVG